MCANTSEAATVCNANHKSSPRLPFAGCPLRPRQTRPNRVAPQEKSNALYTVPFFPPSLTPHPRHPHPFSPSTAIPNSTQPKYKFACAVPLFPSATCLCARANLCLTEAPKKTTNAEYARRASPSEHILTIGSSPGPPAMRPPFRDHGVCFLFDLAAGSLALEKIGNGQALARPSMASGMRRTMRHCTVRTIRPPEIKDETASGTRGPLWQRLILQAPPRNTSETVKNSKTKRDENENKKRNKSPHGRAWRRYSPLRAFRFHDRELAR